MESRTAKKIVYIGADHRGYHLKDQLLLWLEAEGHKVVDMSSALFDPNDDYPDVASRVGAAITAEKSAMGVLLCGSGVGVTVAANKIRGIRAGLGVDYSEVEHGRRADDINVLTLSARSLDLEASKPLIRAFLTTPFSGEERHVRRLKKIAMMESLETS